MKELLFRAVGLALTGSLLAILLKKDSPAMAFAAALASVGALLFAAFEGLKLLRSEAEALFRAGSMEETLLETVIKVTLTSVISKGSADLCRDAGQSAAAYFVELAGTISALILAIPVVKGLIGTINAMFP